VNTLQIPLSGIYTEYASRWEEIALNDVPFIGKWLWMLERGELDVDMFRKLVVDRLINRRNSMVAPMDGDAAWDLWANEGQLADTVNFFFRVTKKESSKFQVSSSKLPSGGKDSKEFKEFKEVKDFEEVKDGVQKQVRHDDGGEMYEVIPDFVKNIVPWVRPGVVLGKYKDFKGNKEFKDDKEKRKREYSIYNNQYSIFSRKQYGPGDFLGEMCFGEYKDLLFCADKYMHTKDEEWLTRMVAIAYRQKRMLLPLLRKLPGYDGRTRRKYISGAVDERIKRFEGVPIGVKYMFFQYVMGCIYTLKTSEGVEIDGHLCNFSVVFNKKAEDAGDDDGVGLTGLIMVLAESGVFGNIKETAEADVWAVLIRLYQLELQRREMDRRMK